MLQVFVIQVLISVTLLSLALILFVDDSFLKAQTLKYDTKLTSDSPITDAQNHTKLLFDHCDLSELDPWDPTIQKFLSPLKNPIKNCKPITQQISKLENGQLFLYFPKESNSENSGKNECRRRCLFPDSDYSLIFGEWIPIQNGTRPQCDIFDVECFKNISGIVSETPFYKFLHSQIYRPNRPKESDANNQRPDVHIIILDSVSSSQFIRSMPKTVHLLRDEYESIIFKHHNKVGMNSRPNGFALLMGKQIYSIAQSPMSQGYPSDYKNNSYCNQHLDNDQFIGFRFQDAGYQTMMAEDWALGVFDWEHCVGFKKPVTDHYMRPFHLRLDGNATFRSPNISQIIHQGSCGESHQYPMEYLQDFVTAYPDKPKFSTVWLSNLAHDDVNALYHTDDYFYNFFKINQQKFANSFIFFMGDHGLRFGDIREKTEIGESEDNNPFLFVSVPEQMRKNGTLMGILRENSKTLTTHYDVYATLVEISKPLPQPRTCDQLRIPFEYCTCKKTKLPIPQNAEIIFPAAKAVIQKMNENLRELKETSECALLSLNPSEPIVMNEFQVEGVTKIYEITFNTLPGNGKFWGFVSYNTKEKTFKVLSEKLSRLNVYAPQAKCAIKARFGSYCFCKNLLLKFLLTKT